MSTQKHLIKRQILDIRLNRQKNAWQIQNQLSEIYHSQIINVLDEVCTRVAEPEQYIQLERIEIDLGAISLFNLEEEFIEQVRKCFFEELYNLVNQVQLKSLPAKETSPIIRKIWGSSTPLISEPDNRIVSQKTFSLELLQHFLSTGTFPWWAEKFSAESLEEICLELLKTAPQEMQQLLEEELVSEKARHRLIYQFSDKLILRLVEFLAQERLVQIQNWLKDLYEIYKQIEFISIPEVEFRLFAWEAVLRRLLIPGQLKLSEKEICEFFIKSVAKRYISGYRTFILAFQKAVDRLLHSQFTFQSPLPEVVATLRSETFADQKATDSLSTEPRAEQPLEAEQPQLADKVTIDEAYEQRSKYAGTFAKEEITDSLSTEPRAEQPLEAEQPQLADKVSIDEAYEQRSKYAGTLAKEEITESLLTELRDEQSQLADKVTIEETYIENAGLVLLWPYLSTFFKNIELLKDTEFVDENSTSRAIHLLQYLVTGQQETPEYFLILNKLLCGWDVSKPLNKGFRLSELEKSESEKLLNTVISHWTALKNTSIKGFQTSFLQRKGMLVKKEKNWLLQVERKAYDLLLERLPWSISIINLSWMKTLLNVEW